MIKHKHQLIQGEAADKAAVGIQTALKGREETEQEKARGDILGDIDEIQDGVKDKEEVDVSAPSRLSPRAEDAEEPEPASSARADSREGAPEPEPQSSSEDEPESLREEATWCK